jgi:hypothetical protein
MKTPKVIFVLDDISEITSRDSSVRTKANIESAVGAAVRLAERMARHALNHFNRVLDQNTTTGMKRAWNGDAKVKGFFGEAPGKDRMRNTCDRLDRAYRRLRDKQLRIRLKPQKGKSWNGHNSGGPLSPRQFVLYPDWFKKGDDERAAIVIHELLHDWHVDHKVKDPRTGKRETAYGARLARALAKDRPGSARRNPENFEQFCLALWP